MKNINNFIIKSNKQCFYTFEAGPTHNGFESAKRLILYSAQSGADAIKFQICCADNLFSDKNYKINYKILKRNGHFQNKKESVYKLIKKRELKDDEWLELKKIADRNKINFFATVFDEEGLNLVKKMKCNSIKIASSDINYHQLISKAAKTKFSIQIDTGNSTIAEIEQTIRIIKKQNNNKIIIHYCPTGYPAENEGINLNYIKYLKKKFGYPVAYSDHSTNLHYSHMAILYGASLIEKTLTENKYYPSIEHCMSVNVHEAKNYINSLKVTEKMINQKLIFLNDKILKKRIVNRRSAYLKKNIKKNERIFLSDIEFKRPGFGISPDNFNQLIGKKTRKNLRKNSILKKSDLI